MGPRGDLTVLCFILFLRSVSCEGEKKEVVQSGQPTSFQMEDRGPEIQVTADSEGVKINAKPAGLNVVAKPGPNNVVEKNVHANSAPVSNNPQMMHFNNDPVAYSNNGLNGPIVGNAGIGLAARGDMQTGNNNNNIMSGPTNTNGLQFASNGNIGPERNVGPQQFYPQATAFSSANSPVELPTDYVDYLRWKAGYQADDDLLHHLYHHHHHVHHHPHHGHHHRHHYDDDDDYYDDDYY